MKNTAFLLTFGLLIIVFGVSHAGLQFQGSQCESNFTCDDCVFSRTPYDIQDENGNVIDTIDLCSTTGGGEAPEGQEAHSLCSLSEVQEQICENTGGDPITCLATTQYWCLDDEGETTHLCLNCSCGPTNPVVGGGVVTGESGCTDL